MEYMRYITHTVYVEYMISYYQPGNIITSSLDYIRPHISQTCFNIQRQLQYFSNVINPKIIPKMSNELLVLEPGISSWIFRALDHPLVSLHSKRFPLAANCPKATIHPYNLLRVQNYGTMTNSLLCKYPIKEPIKLNASQMSFSIWPFSYKRKTIDAVELANSFQQDPIAQAEAYRLLLKTDPLELIERYESRKFASNEECASYYLEALSKTNELDRAIPFVLSSNKINNEKKSSNNTPSKHVFKKHGSSHISLHQPLLGSKDKPLFVTTIPAKPTWGSRIWMIFLFSLGIGLILSLPFLRLNGQRVIGIQSRVHQFFKKDSTAPIHTFQDVQGCDEAKQELQEIVAFLKNPERFAALEAKLPKGVLLVGPPGTGKTLLAKAIAGEAGVPFIYASGSEFDEMFVGVGSMRIRQMFQAAKEQAPSIIFIDELDAVGSKRNPRDPQHARMSLNQLLVELDGFSETKGVIVLAATNFPESLDKALLRPGRFDRHIYVPLPDIRGRTQILSLYLCKVPMAPDVDIQTLAKSTPGFSGADLYKLVNSAKILASVKNTKAVRMEHLEQAKDEMLLGTERKSAIITEKDRRLTAYHEGGHALVALHTPYSMPIHKATIMPRGQTLGMVAQLPDNDQLSMSKVELLAKLDVCMGGRVAEEIIYGKNMVTTGAASDFTNATAIARSMVTRYGMSDLVGPLVINSDEEYERLSPETKSMIDQEIHRLFDISQQRVKSLLQSHIGQLHILADALLERETLTRIEIESLLKGEPLPPLLPTM